MHTCVCACSCFVAVQGVGGLYEEAPPCICGYVPLLHALIHLLYGAVPPHCTAALTTSSAAGCCTRVSASGHPAIFIFNTCRYTHNNHSISGSGVPIREISSPIFSQTKKMHITRFDMMVMWDNRHDRLYSLTFNDPKTMFLRELC